MTGANIKHATLGLTFAKPCKTTQFAHIPTCSVVLWLHRTSQRLDTLGVLQSDRIDVGPPTVPNASVPIYHTQRRKCRSIHAGRPGNIRTAVNTPLKQQYLN